jgi:hypothetical protein
MSVAHRTAWIIGVCFWAATCLAQIRVSSSLPVKKYLLFDNIPLQLEITNNTGEDLVLREDDENNHVMLRLRNMDNQVIPRTELPILKEPWVIPDGETQTREFDLVRLFRIRSPESFRGLQHVVVDGETFAGPPLLFDVRTGMLVDEIVRKKEDRVFTLLGLNQAGGDVLFLRVTNREKSMTLATYLLERHLRFYPPHMKASKDGQIGILQYIAPRQAVLSTFSPDGSSGKRDYFQVSPGVPLRLHIGEESGFRVEGGTPVSTGESP